MIKKYKTSRSQMFFKISVLKNFAGKQLRWNLVLIKLQTFRRATLIKRVFNKSAFLWNLQNFQQNFFYRTLPVAASESKINIILQMMKRLVFYRLEFSRFMNFLGNLGNIKENRLKKPVFSVKWNAWSYESALQNFQSATFLWSQRSLFHFHEKDVLKRERLCEKFFKRKLKR